MFAYLQGRKQPFLGFKNDIMKKSKNLDFFKGVNTWFWSMSRSRVRRSGSFEKRRCNLDATIVKLT